MNKQELVHSVALKADKTKKETEEFINSFIQTIVATLATGEKVVLVGFGSFERKERQPRKARNPKTNEPILVPAKFVPVFKVGKDFHETLNPELKK